MKTKTILITFIGLFAISALFFQACKKENTKPQNEEIIIPSTTKVIDSATWQNTFVSVDTSNYSFTFKENPGLNIGDIIVSSEDGGYLRKITNIKQEENNVVCETEFASITEAIEKTKAEYQTDLVVDNKKLESAFLDKGITIDKETLKNSNNTDLHLDIDYVIYDADGNMNTTGDQIKLTGTYGSSTTFKAEVDIDHFDLKKLAFTYIMTKQKSLEITCGLASLNLTKEKRVAKIPFNDIIIPAGIPIVIQPVLELYVGVSLDVSSQVSMGVHEDINYTTTVQYLNGEWTTDKTIDKDFGFLPPSLSNSLNLTAYIKPELKFKIYHILSPKVDAKLYGKIDANMRNINWEIYDGFQAGVGVEMKVFDKSLIDFNLNIIDLKIIVANGTIGSTSPVAVFTATPTSGTAPLTVNFTDQSTNSPTSWQWDFGDGNTSTQQNPSHTYNSAGTYTVWLTATNSDGADTKIRNDYITVNNGGGGGEPCPGTPTVTDADGNVYNTVQIGYQCWMKENLKVGTRIDSSQNMSNNGTIEKYCYGDNEANCDTYGGLYQWDEMMQYTTTQGAQGICPDGWHIPTHEEWKILEGTVDSQYGVGDNEWNSKGVRGYDAGKRLKSINGWENEGNGNDMYGFNAKPGGSRSEHGYFGGIGMSASFWTSNSDPSHSDEAFHRFLSYEFDGIMFPYYNDDGKNSAQSVRCIKDE